MSSADTKTPTSYHLLVLGPKTTGRILQAAVDPYERLRRVRIFYHDWTVQDTYLNHIFRDLASVHNMKNLYPTIVRLSENLRHTRVYQNAGLSFEPKYDGKPELQVRITPVKAVRSSFVFSQFVLGDTFGLGGTYRKPNAIGLLDTLSLNIVAGVYGPINGSYSLVHSFPFFRRDFGMNLSMARNYSRLTPNVNETNSFVSISFNKRNLLFKLTHAWRANDIHSLGSTKEVSDPEVLPSRKLSLSGQAYWNHVNETKSAGNRATIDGEVGIVEGVDKFSKLRVKNESFYAVNLSKSRPQGRPYQIVFENLFDFGVVRPLGNSVLRINDRHFRNRMRGFNEILSADSENKGGLQKVDFLGDYRGDDLYLKNTVKVNLNEQIPIMNVGFTPFVHFTYGYFAENVYSNRPAEKDTTSTAGLDDKSRDQRSRYSFGFGLSSRVNSLVSCELLLNLWSLGTRSDKATALQFHIDL